MPILAVVTLAWSVGLCHAQAPVRHAQAPVQLPTLPAEDSALPSVETADPPWSVDISVFAEPAVAEPPISEPPLPKLQDAAPQTPQPEAELPAPIGTTPPLELETSPSIPLFQVPMDDLLDFAEATAVPPPSSSQPEASSTEQSRKQNTEANTPLLTESERLRQSTATLEPHDMGATEPLSLLPTPWWAPSTSSPLRGPGQAFPLRLDDLFAMTATHSGRVQAVAQTPWVQQMQVEQALAAFDPTLYNDTRFDSTSDPVENTLTTGGPPRLEDEIFGAEAGLRGASRSGGTYSVGQRLGHKNSNSDFFFPNNQGSARLSASFQQSLLRGRRIDVNRSLVLTTRFDSLAAQAEYEKALQQQLFQVADTYWTLYIERAYLVQRRRHLLRAQEISERLSSRQMYDAAQNQVLRARAAVATRKAELAQADARIRNLESRLRALVNAPEWTENRDAEFLPVQPALLLPIEFDIETEVASALQRRPAVVDLANQIAAANVRLQLAQDQLRPQLDFVAEGYLAGLEGESNIASAWGNQFSQGRPGYAAGLVYERPVGNRAAQAAVRQRKYELQELHHLLREMNENIRAEVETAVRNLRAAKAAALDRQVSLDAVVAEVDYLMDRWRLLGADPRIGPLQLNELLNGQDRLLQEEQGLLQAIVQYNQALLEVQRATGLLIQFAP